MNLGFVANESRSGGRELWIGVETDRPIEWFQQRFHQVVDADGMTEAELASVGVTEFRRV
jgi:hypothetical protein